MFLDKIKVTIFYKISKLTSEAIEVRVVLSSFFFSPTLKMLLFCTGGIFFY